MFMQYLIALHAKSRHVPALQSLLDSSTSPKKPARIAIIDFAGDEVYRDAQHAYMTSLCNYIVVFRVTDVDTDNADCDATYSSVSQWLNSVSAHTMASAPCTYIVATHKATPAADESVRRARLESLQRRLRHNYSHLLVPIPGGSSESEVIFQVENRYRIDDDAKDLQLLRRSIVDHTRSQEVPLVWFHFLDMVRDGDCYDELGGPLPDVSRLLDAVRAKCELRDVAEL